MKRNQTIALWIIIYFLIVFLPSNVYADEVNTKILEFLKKNQEGSTSSNLQEELKKSQSTISQHLKILMENNLIASEKRDNINYYFIRDLNIFKILSIVNSYINRIDQREHLDKSKRDLYDLLL